MATQKTISIDDLSAHLDYLNLSFVQEHYLEPQVRAAHVDEMRRARDITYYMRQCDIRETQGFIVELTGRQVRGHDHRVRGTRPCTQ